MLVVRCPGNSDFSSRLQSSDLITGFVSSRTSSLFATHMISRHSRLLLTLVLLLALQWNTIHVVAQDTNAPTPADATSEPTTAPTPSDASPSPVAPVAAPTEAPVDSRNPTPSKPTSGGGGGAAVCVNKLKRDCNCGLVSRGSPCANDIIRTECSNSRSNGFRSQVKRRYNKFCRYP